MNKPQLQLYNKSYLNKCLIKLFIVYWQWNNHKLKLNMPFINDGYRKVLLLKPAVVLQSDSALLTIYLKNPRLVDYWYSLVQEGNRMGEFPVVTTKSKQRIQNTLFCWKHALARSYSFINVGNLLRWILKQRCRNAALVLTLGQPYLALHNLPEVFGFPAEIHTHVRAKTYHTHTRRKRKQKPKDRQNLCVEVCVTQICWMYITNMHTLQFCVSLCGCNTTSCVALKWRVHEVFEVHQKKVCALSLQSAFKIKLTLVSVVRKVF